MFPIFAKEEDSGKLTFKVSFKNSSVHIIVFAIMVELKNSV
jgi:hypothetical protein